MIKIHLVFIVCLLFICCDDILGVADEDHTHSNDDKTKQSINWAYENSSCYYTDNIYDCPLDPGESTYSSQYYYRYESINLLVDQYSDSDYLVEVCRCIDAQRFVNGFLEDDFNSDDCQENTYGCDIKPIDSIPLTYE